MTFANTAQNQKRSARRPRHGPHTSEQRWGSVAVGWTLRLQYVCCGKPRCGRCKGTAYKHGPYWYGFQHREGKMRSRYVGKAPRGPEADKRDREHRESRGPVGGAPGPRSPRFAFDGKMTLSSALRIMAFDATPSGDALKRRWRTIIQDHHPDRGGDGRVAAAINAAYTYLKGHAR